MSGKMFALANSHAKLVIVTLLLLVSILTTGFMMAQNKVTIVADGVKVQVETDEQDPLKILNQANITLGPDDEYRLSTETLTNGTTIRVLRATPVTVTYQGETKEIITAKLTVRELLDSLGIPKENVKLNLNDTLHIVSGLNIEAVTVAEEICDREITQPFDIIREPNPQLERGMEKVLQEGQNGVKNATVKVFYEDGKEVNAEILSENVITTMRPQILSVGTRDTIQTSRGDLRFKKSYYMEATAYLPTDGGGHGITATGVRARHGIVAVDPRVIPLGSYVYIEGYGRALAADTGGAIKGHKIDLCMESLTDALNFGRRTIKVYLLEE